MAIKSKPKWALSENEVTSEELYLNRRKLLKGTSLVAASQILPASLLLSTQEALAFQANGLPAKLNPLYDLKDPKRTLTKEDLATSYNNFYEFSLEKNEVKKKVEGWKLAENWSVEVTGLTEKKKVYDVNELIKMAGGLEERIYRFRCVEAWSMVIPWSGFALEKLIPKLLPKNSAKYVVFQTFNDPKIGTNMKLQPQYPWPYQEGLKMDEALNPLSFMAVGMYGKNLPKQNGAPMRLVVPWKYGFKNIKSIVKIEFTSEQPKTLWNQLASDEYGFYANVNPEVNHPRWSQATERVIDGKFFPTKIPTLPFNGYEKEVASLYKGMDLKKFY